MGKKEEKKEKREKKDKKDKKRKHEQDSDDGVDTDSDSDDSRADKREKDRKHGKSKKDKKDKKEKKHKKDRDDEGRKPHSSSSSSSSSKTGQKAYLPLPPSLLLAPPPPQPFSPVVRLSPTDFFKKTDLLRIYLYAACRSCRLFSSSRGTVLPPGDETGGVVTLPAVASPGVPLSFSDLDSAQTRLAFDEHFVPDYNEGVLSALFYTGDDGKTLDIAAILAFIREQTSRSRWNLSSSLSLREKSLLSNLSSDGGFNPSSSSSSSRPPASSSSSSSSSSSLSLLPRPSVPLASSSSTPADDARRLAMESRLRAAGVDPTTIKKDSLLNNYHSGGGAR